MKLQLYCSCLGVSTTVVVFFRLCESLRFRTQLRPPPARNIYQQDLSRLQQRSAILLVFEHHFQSKLLLLLQSLEAHNKPLIKFQAICNNKPGIIHFYVRLPSPADSCIGRRTRSVGATTNLKSCDASAG